MDDLKKEVASIVKTSVVQTAGRIRFYGRGVSSINKNTLETVLIVHTPTRMRMFTVKVTEKK